MIHVLLCILPHQHFVSSTYHPPFLLHSLFLGTTVILLDLILQLVIFTEYLNDERSF